MIDPGRTFEAQILASLPRWRHLHGRKVPDVPGALDRASPAGWDLEVRWILDPERFGCPRRHYEIVAECKSTAAGSGREGYSLPFIGPKGLKTWTNPKTKKVVHRQEHLLMAVADAGAFAGILWELRRPGQDWLAVWVPIAAWRARRLAGRRKSLAWEEARADGILIRPDAERMKRARTRTYYNLAPLLAHLAGGVPQP